MVHYDKAIWCITTKPYGALRHSHMAHYDKAIWCTTTKPYGALRQSHMVHYGIAIWRITTKPYGALQQGHISRVDKQRCITASFFESAYLISKFAEFYVLSCWEKCIYYNEHQSLWSKSCSNNAYLLECLRFVLQKCVSLIHFEGAYVPYYYTWYITGLHQNVMWPKCISL